MVRVKSGTRERNSSIALLQERFRKLQKAKKLREQRELLRLLSGSQQLLHSELILPGRLGNFLIRHTHYPVGEMPVFSNVDSVDRVMNRRNTFDDSEVDTSLHL